MTEPERSFDDILLALRERAKEFSCLYRVDEILSRHDAPPDEVMNELVPIIPSGWQFPDVCGARIEVRDTVYGMDGPPVDSWAMSADVAVQGEPAGTITVFYTERRPKSDEGPFLAEERRLIQAIADRIGLYLLQRRLRMAYQTMEAALQSGRTPDRPAWVVMIDFMRRTDPALLERVTRKMVNYLSWSGVSEVRGILQGEPGGAQGGEGGAGGENRPAARKLMRSTLELTQRVFEIAALNIGESELMSSVQGWIQEEKASFLIRTLENMDSNLGNIIEAVERYQSASVEESELPPAVQMSLRVSLLQRLFTDRLEYINLAKKHVQISDFYDLVRHVVYPPQSQGKLGGKAAGLYVADHILRRHTDQLDQFGPIKVPKTWHVASDGVLAFMRHNNLDDLYKQKYVDIERIRQDYPHIVQVFKNSQMPPEIVKGLAVVLDDFEDRPLIVRSSSLLEDRTGSAFSGKYKSLFLANQGSKRERLAALQDAIAEVYASIFGPDPIEYRAERGLLDFREEMGIMIQEVVGQRVGNYFLPAFAGVGFTNNEFRWSARIRREDGLLRLVPGLGTRAVDRIGDDYPVLVSPGQPQLRVNVSMAEVLRYCPRYVDVINLDRNAFETVDLRSLLRECREDYPMVRSIISMVDRDRLRTPSALEPDWDNDEFVVTLDGLTHETQFVAQIRTVMEILSEELGTPVDIEFAHDGKDLYLLQCRPQSYAREDAPGIIPHDLVPEDIVFSAHRFISNGRLPDITHIVYVDPAGYASLPTHKDLTDVAGVVRRLNKLLPKRQFILIGPGRWGSRGDIKLGVGVTYSDINNTAALLEVSSRKSEFAPEVSFGTHFFQDLVEAQIRYIPLYPEEPGNVFNEEFLLGSRNILPGLLPEFAGLASTVHVIDVPAHTDGRVLRVVMNGDFDEAVGFLAAPGHGPRVEGIAARSAVAPAEDHWRWRMRMAERIGATLDADHFGVKALYVIGSTKNATAGPNSDIDLVVHFTGSKGQRHDLHVWLDGWNASLAEMNYLRTGYRTEKLLDVHFVTDADITRGTTYAAKIGAVTDAARPLTLRRGGV